MIPSGSKLLLRDADWDSFLTPSVALKTTFLNALLRKRASEASWIQKKKHSTQYRTKGFFLSNMNKKTQETCTTWTWETQCHNQPSNIANTTTIVAAISTAYCRAQKYTMLTLVIKMIGTCHQSRISIMSPSWTPSGRTSFLFSPASHLKTFLLSSTT